VIVATYVQHTVATTIATTTSFAEGNADSLVFLKDATVVVQNVCVAASSIVPVFALAPVALLAALMSWLLV
jgi:hypothetical protein